MDYTVSTRACTPNQNMWCS